MPPKKNNKPTRKELLEKKRIAERLRYERLNKDPQKREELREKERQKYLKKKEKGLRKVVKDMTYREHKTVKRTWKKHCATYRAKNKTTKMGLGLPLLIANSQSLTGWNGGGPFSPPNDRKVLCPMPIGFPNVQNSSDILNSRNNPFNQNQKTETTTAAAAEETIEIDEKDDEHQNQTTSSAASSNATPAAANNFSAQQDNEELAIKQEMSDFSHHPPLGRSDSHRSFDNSSPDDNRTENDEFAQDLRVSAAAQGIDFSRYSLARGLLQQSERYDSNCSPPPPLPRKHHQTNQMHSNAQQQSAMATSGNSNEQDDCDYVGSNVSIKLRSMERTQRIIAEKLISEVLFYGQIAELEKTAKIQPK
ncbi:uncharacterized protein LOC129905538 isoform X2 [Episyrphus balteatus]|uniref:uncharacterized protein LOC129905538 isoform X2 n=1 Tax=Episyrphus balteatus TaxID=286459 RepID=UPI002486AC25|nr:uncharacterized protein LOC129905538 isoform X2 [Episyrphus balteatus]